MIRSTVARGTKWSRSPLHASRIDFARLEIPRKVTDTSSVLKCGTDAIVRKPNTVWTLHTTPTRHGHRPTIVNEHRLPARQHEEGMHVGDGEVERVAYAAARW